MNNRYGRQLFLGLVILAIGSVALLAQFGVIKSDWGSLWSNWWPLIIVAVGIFALLSNPRAPLGPLIAIGIGGFLLVNTLGLVNIDFWGIFWPVILMTIGVVILVRTFASPRGHEEDTVNSTVIFWGAALSNASSDFKGGTLTAIAGGIEVDLRQAHILQQAKLSVFTFWGGLEIKVPADWRVELTGLPLLGGWENKTVVPMNPDAPVLLVNATCIMGGLEIKNGKPVTTQTF